MRLGSARPSNPRQLMRAKVRADQPLRTTDIPSRTRRGDIGEELNSFNLAWVLAAPLLGTLKHLASPRCDRSLVRLVMARQQPLHQCRKSRPVANSELSIRIIEVDLDGSFRDVRLPRD